MCLRTRVNLSHSPVEKAMMGASLSRTSKKAELLEISPHGGDYTDRKLARREALTAQLHTQACALQLSISVSHKPL